MGSPLSGVGYPGLLGNCGWRRRRRRGTQAAPGLAGRRARGAPSPPLHRLRYPQGAAPAPGGPHRASPPYLSSGAAAVTWVPLSREGKFKQQSEESRLSSEGRGWGLVQIHAVRAGLPDPGHQRQSSIPLSGAQHPPTPRLSLSFFGFCYSCCYFPFPAFPWEAPVPQAGISSLGPAPALEGDEPGRGATATGAFTPAHTFPAGVTFTGIWRWVPWTCKSYFVYPRGN